MPVLLVPMAPLVAKAPREGGNNNDIVSRKYIEGFKVASACSSADTMEPRQVLLERSSVER